jgi:hypothetical protein
MNSDTKSRFHGRFNLSRVGLFGQSFGGAAAAEACSTDSRCKAAVDIDGNLFGDVLNEGIKQPFLFVLSDWTLRPPWLQKTLADVSVKRFQQEQAQLKQEMQDTCQDSAHCWKVHIPGTRHFNFTDLPVLYSPGMRMMGYLGPVDGAKGLAETSSCVRAFFDKMLNPPSQSQPPQSSNSGCSFQPLGHSPAKLESVVQ